MTAPRPDELLSLAAPHAGAAFTAGQRRALPIEHRPADERDGGVA